MGGIMPEKKEVRYIDIQIAELRAKADGDSKRLVGYASIFDSPTEMWDFSEVIRAGTFLRAIKERQDTKALKNHDNNLILGRVKNNTLFLLEDNKGLYMESIPPDTQIGRDVIIEVENGYIDQMSFAFVVPEGGDRWTTTEDGKLLREILDVDLYDVSIVTYPQYVDTSAGVRNNEFRTAKEVFQEFQTRQSQERALIENKEAQKQELRAKVRQVNLDIVKLRMKGIL